MNPQSDGKASPGSPFKPPAARMWNNMVDAGQAWADARISNGEPPPTRPRETDIIKVKNSSGADRRKGEILKIDGKVIDTITDESIWLDGVAVTAECRFGILKKPVETDGIESLQVSGVCIALVEITDAAHTFAEAADGEYVLQSGSSGSIEILYAPSGTGEKECVVRFAGGASSRIRHGIVTSQNGCGYYTIELATWIGNQNTSGAGSGVGNSGVGSVDTDCNPCYNTTGEGTTACAITLTYPPLQVAGTGVSVTAYDEETRLVPLKVGSGCLLVNLGDTDADDTTAIWQIVRGLQEHLVAYKDRYECCPGGTEEVLVGRTPYIFAAVECDEIPCSSCPS